MTDEEMKKDIDSIGGEMYRSGYAVAINDQVPYISVVNRVGEVAFFSSDGDAGELIEQAGVMAESYVVDDETALLYILKTVGVIE